MNFLKKKRKINHFNSCVYNINKYTDYKKAPTMYMLGVCYAPIFHFYFVSLY